MSKTYTTISGDSWDSVAYKVMGNEMYTDKLIKNNLKYRDITIFSAGTILDIPDIEDEVAVELPPWKRI